MRRERLRPAHGEKALAGLYRVGDSDPLDHADHRLRIPLTGSVGQWLAEEHDLATGADLSCGYDALLAGEIPRIRTWWLGDVGATAGGLGGPIEETVERIDPVDLFVCTETVEHLDDPDDTLSRIRQKTRFLLLSTPVGSWDDPTPGHYWAWDREAVEAMLGGAGFRTVAYAELGFAAPDLPHTFGIWGAR